MITIHKYIFALIKSLAYTFVFMRYWLLRPWMEGDPAGWFNLDNLDIIIGFIILFIIILWEFYQAGKVDDPFFSKLYKDLDQKKDEQKDPTFVSGRSALPQAVRPQSSPMAKKERPVPTEKQHSKPAAGQNKSGSYDFEAVLARLQLTRSQWYQLKDVVLEHRYGRELDIPPELEDHEVVRLVKEYRQTRNEKVLQRAAETLTGYRGGSVWLFLDKS
ncbi:MAG: hypothetical protein HQK56_14615 [Deltaproteobacteria bacterium]|nr:hypothetical protein [Deltaproteobacteria bacterium]